MNRPNSLIWLFLIKISSKCFGLFFTYCSNKVFKKSITPSSFKKLNLRPKTLILLLGFYTIPSPIWIRPLFLILLYPNSTNSNFELCLKVSPKALAPSKEILLLKRFRKRTELFFLRLEAIAWPPLVPILFFEISTCSKMLLYSNIFAKIFAPSFPKLFFDKFKTLIYEQNCALLGSKAIENKSASFLFKLHPVSNTDSKFFDLAYN